MIESVRNALALPDLRRRILFTIGMLVIYRLVSNIPVPGVDLQAWLSFTQGQGFDNQLIDLLNLLSGGAVANFSVLAMGVYPYITASIIIQLLTPIIPQLEEMASEGEQGRNRLNKLTYYMTVPLALLQAVGQIRLIGFSLGDLSQIMPFFGFTPTSNILPTLTTLLSMTAGTMFAIWLGEQITEEGIGQGVSLIIFGGIVAEIPTNLLRLFAPTVDSTARIFTFSAFVIMTILTVLVIVVVQEGQRRLPVQYGRRVRGRKVYQGQSTYIPMKVNTAGMIPIIFAQSLLTFPALIAQFFINQENTGTMSNIATYIANAFGQATGFAYWFFYFVLVVGFTFFYTDVMVQQQNLAQTLQRQGGFIPGIRPGRRTESYIMSVVRRITLVGAVFLGVVAVLPGIMELFGNLLQIPDLEQSALVVSGAGLIIVVGVVIDTMRQLEAQLLMRHYEGFIG
ncbi:MAG: preprotein translocase subunit SecY [Chloroflexota bacterium]